MAARGRLAVRAGHGRALLRLYGRSHIRFIPAHALVDTHRQQRSCGGAVRWGEPQHATCRTHGSAATKEFEPNRWLHRNQAAASALVKPSLAGVASGPRGSLRLLAGTRASADATSPDLRGGHGDRWSQAARPTSGPSNGNGGSACARDPARSSSTARAWRQQAQSRGERPRVAL